MAKKGSDARGPSSRKEKGTAFEQEFPGASESANAVVIELVRTYNSVMSTSNRALASTGLSAAGRQALAIIEGAHAPLSPTVIAQRLLVTTASVTSLLDTLENRGFVARMPDPDDRRKVLVHLTPDGQKLVDDFLPRIVALQTAIVANLSETERRQLLHHLAAVHEAADGLDGEAVAASAPKRGKPRRT